MSLIPSMLYLQNSANILRTENQLVCSSKLMDMIIVKQNRHQ